VGLQPAQAPPCCTNFVLFDVALLESKGLTNVTVFRPAVKNDLTQ